MPKSSPLRRLLLDRCAPHRISTAALRVYYCICGEFILVIDKSLTALPRRQTDGATEPILVDAKAGTRSNTDFTARDAPCKLRISPHRRPQIGPLPLRLKGALSLIQGQVPADAFEDEKLVAVAA
ncbi:uncharacterized protein BXZ73DRAFT_105374 [Epithele typhae]|uniref:uncharacterized protein n=1 Tax=Epithele typhae TaxID=378194 RepID=UPI002008E1E0|nr:uncharacterized protein BXZ73DRAFT_105374 [Epithele typhae]KAH9918247.1 hypothetical protein BXZ73DRAFT_105374 [Epithele typhae]